MILKIILFVAACLPIFLFLRSIFGRRKFRISESLAELKKQADWTVSIFVYVIAGVVALALGHLAWTWWAAS